MRLMIHATIPIAKIRKPSTRASLTPFSIVSPDMRILHIIQVALNFVGMAEALVLGAKAGVDPAIVLKVLSGGYAQTRVMDVRGPKIVAGDFAPGFKSRFHYKDLNIIMATARDLNVPLPATAMAHELFSTLLAQGRGDLDHSAVITVLEDMSGVKARTKGAR